MAEPSTDGFGAGQFHRGFAEPSTDGFGAGPFHNSLDGKASDVAARLH